MYMDVTKIEGQVSLYHTLFLACAIAAAACLVVTVFLLLFFRIPSIIGELTGRTARKAISAMEEHNARTGRLGTGGAAGKGRRKQKPNKGKTEHMKNLPLQEMAPFMQETEPLVQETVPLQYEAPAFGSGIGGFRVTRELMMIHTEEIIES